MTQSRMLDEDTYGLEAHPSDLSDGFSRPT